MTQPNQSDIDRKIDEKIALQNRLLSLIGVKDGDPRYADVLIITDYVLALINEARLDGAIMGAKFGNAAFRQNSIAKPGNPINLDAVLQSGIEQATKWAKPDTTLEGGK